MSLADCKRSHEQSPPSIQHIQDQIRSTCEDIIHFCSQETEATFYQAELGCLNRALTIDRFLDSGCRNPLSFAL